MNYLQPQILEAPIINTGFAYNLTLEFDVSQFSGETYTAILRKGSGGSDILSVSCTMINDKSFSFLLSAANTTALASALDFHIDTDGQELEYSRVFIFFKKDSSNFLLMDGHLKIPVVKVYT